MTYRKWEMNAKWRIVMEKQKMSEWKKRKRKCDKEDEWERSRGRK